MKFLFNKSKLSSLNAQTVLSLVSIFVLDAITYITNPIFANLLSTSAYGTVSLYSSYREIIMVVFGLQTLGSISYAAVNYKDKEYDKYCSCALTLSSISFVLCSIITIALMNQVGNLLDLPSLLIPFLVMQSFGNYIVSFNSYRLIYKKKAGSSALISGIVSLSGTILSIILIFIFKNVWNYDGYWGRIIGVFAPNIIVGTGLLIFIFTRAKPNFDKRFLKVCLIVSVPMIFHRLGQIFLARTDIIMINTLMSGDEGYKKTQVAIYSYAVSMGSVVGVIFNAFNNTWVAFLFDDYKTGNFDRIRKRSKNYLRLFSALTFGFLMISSEVIRWFVPSDYHYGVYLIPLMVLSSYFMFVYSFFVNIEIYHAKTLYTMIGTLCAAAINVLLNYLFIKRFGIFGASLATVISYSLLIVFHAAICNIKYKQYCIFPISFFVVEFIIVLIGVGMCYFFPDSIRSRWPFGFIALFYIIYSIYKRKSIF